MSTKISELPAATTPIDGTEQVPLVQSSASKKVSVADLAKVGMFAKSGSYYGPPMANTVAYTGLDVCRFYPIRVAVGGTFDRIGVLWNSTPGDATMTMRLGIYADSNGLPGAKLAEGTFPAGQSAFAWVEAVISLAVTPGRYWLAQAQNGTGTPGTICGDGGYRAEDCPLNSTSVFYGRVLYKTSGVTGVLPDPASWDWQDTGAPFIGVRKT